MESCKIILNIINKAKQSIERGDKFKQNGDIPATLINYTLAYNSYEIAKTSLPNMTDQWCNQTYKMLNEKQMIIGRQIPYLQNKLQQLVSRGNIEGDESDCSMVKHLSLVGKNCLYFRDVIGLEKVKLEIKNSFINPIMYPNLYPKLAKGILMYGLPGVGKTFIVKAAVNELQSDNIKVIFYAPTGAELKGKYVGETEKKISSYFDCASKDASKCDQEGIKYLSVLFIDEIEAIGGDRNMDNSGLMTNSVNMLLQKMDGIKEINNVVVIAATNFPWKLDSALKRRFTNEINIPLPSKEDIFALISQQLSNYFEIKNFNKVEKDDSKEVEVCSINNCLKLNNNKNIYDIFKIFEIEPKELINKIIPELVANSFSNSDIIRYISKVITLASNRAVESGLFRRIKFPGTDQDIFLSLKNKKSILNKNIINEEIINLHNYPNNFLKIDDYVMINTKNIIDVDDAFTLQDFVDFYINEKYFLIKEEDEKKYFFQRSSSEKFDVHFKIPIVINSIIKQKIVAYGMSSISMQELYKLRNIDLGEVSYDYEIVQEPAIFILLKNTKKILIKQKDKLYDIKLQDLPKFKDELIKNLKENYKNKGENFASFEVSNENILKYLSPDIEKNINDLKESTNGEGFIENYNNYIIESLKAKLLSSFDVKIQSKIKNLLKTTNITFEDFQKSLKIIKSTINDKDRKLISEYTKNPGKFNIEQQTKL